MPKFSDVSTERLATCHPDLQKLFNEVIKHYDCSILCGHRSEAEQNDVYRRGLSKVMFPFSKHNKFPSMAVDVMPFPVDWTDTKKNYHFVGYVQATARQMGILIRAGADFNSDMKLNNDMFIDLPHFELIG